MEWSWCAAVGLLLLHCRERVVVDIRLDDDNTGMGASLYLYIALELGLGEPEILKRYLEIDF